jgi:hypothetical protein
MALALSDIHVVYISLEKRPQRRAAIETQCAQMGLVPVPFLAVDCTPKGYIGCTISHLSVLRHARAQGWSHVLVLEDDFRFLVDSETLRRTLGNLFSVPFDVFMLSYVGQRHKEPSFEGGSRALNVQTSAGYVVHSRFYNTLIANFEEGLRLLLKTDEHKEHALDIWWKRLQDKSEWFVSEPRIGKQASGFSDCMDAFVDYGHLETD